MKFLRREVARKCPVHQAVLDESLNQLAEYGYFSKNDIIEQIGMPAMAEAVRWEYVAEFNKQDGACE